jgi:hypothetical protein
VTTGNQLNRLRIRPNPWLSGFPLLGSLPWEEILHAVSLLA